MGDLVCVQAHAIITKACMVLGTKERVVKTLEEDNWAFRGTQLAQAVAESRAAGRIPIAVVATTGSAARHLLHRLKYAPCRHHFLMRIRPAA